MDTYEDTREQAIHLLREEADVALFHKVQDGIDKGTLEVVPDPAVPGVWGIKVKAHSRIVVIIYTADADFKVDESWVDGEWA